MTREFSTKPRFEDNGDIEPCDTETRMMNRPDDLGVNEASSVKKGAAPRGDDAVISVPLLQSPTSSQCQGQGDDKARSAGKPEENNVTDELQSVQVLLNGNDQVYSGSISVTSQSSQDELRLLEKTAGNFDAIEDAFDKENQDSNDEAFVEIKSAVSPVLPGRGLQNDCHDSARVAVDGSRYISSQSLMIDDDHLLFNADNQNLLGQSSSSSFVSVINSSADDNSKPYDDSCNKMTIENQFLTTLMIKPSDYDDDIDLTSEVNNDACWAKQSPSTDVQTTGLNDETDAAIAAGGIGLFSDGVKDQSPKNNAISSKFSSKNGGTRSDAGAVLSQVATNDIPYFDDNTELPSFKKDAHNVSMASSLSPLNTSCASQLLSKRSGWGIPMAGLIGLKGGAGGETSVANGTSGWGPPPAGAGGASTTGWGAPPPPNPVASAAWGAPAPGQGKTQNDDGSNNIPAPVAKPSAPIAAPPPSVVAPNASSTSSGVPVQPPQTSTSWAAAAGKGLPTTTNDQTHTTNTASTTNGSTSKHLEQLNSVREALFSQDGWGGSNVKQDSAWNVDVAPAAASSAAGAASASGASASAAADSKESNMWGSAGPTNRNDGTDLWRVNLSGQPASAATKTQANNAWNHTPQNNTDFKQWGVDDEDGSAGANNGAIGGQRQGNAGPANDSMWNAGGPSESNGPNHFNKRSNDWSSSGSTGSWGDAPGNPGRNDPMNRNMNDPMGHRDNAPGGSGAAGWGPSPQKQPSGQWSNNPAPARSNSSTWDLESPSMPRRGIDDGTSHWGFKSQQQPAAPGPAGVSHWKDMPNSNNQIRGPPGPAGPRVGGPVKDNSIWPRGPTSGWGNDMADSQMGYGGGGGGSSSWGDLDAKREGSGWPDSNNSSNWGRTRNPVGPSNGGMHRSSPGWGGPDDSPLDGGSGWPTGGLKAPGPKKPTPGNDMSMMWQQNKPYRMLVEMGYRKEDIETALRNSNGTLEDAVEVLNSAGRMPQSRNDPMFGGHNDASNLYQDGPRGRGGFHGASGGPGQGMPPFPGQDPGALVNSSGMPSSFNSPNPMIQKMLPSGAGGLNPQSSSTGLPPSSLSMPPISSTRPQQPGSSQPSAQQLRMLVQQIQMAVQAGHLNPQILNQPLAPQTLLLLNQLLQQIKNLQTLQQNHTMAQAQKGPGMSNSRDLLSISVNITKAKQHITNLQNQISAQQATYLKSQNMAGSGPASGGLTGSVPPGVAAAEPSMPDLFNELTLSGSSNSGMGDNVGGSRLSQWKLNASDNNLFGNNKSNATSKSSPGLGFGGDDTWGLSSNSTSSGWPDSKPSSGSTNTISTSGGTSTSNANNDVLNGIDTFGIPEFEPGKPWKGPGLKNPDEDPTLTPGSVAPSAIDLMSKTNHNSSSAGSSGMSSENTLGLTSTTWSVQGLTSPESNNKPKDSWSTNPTSTLTAMGQDLWGKSGRTPPGLGGWPSTSSSSNGWSSGQNGASNANNNPADAPTWLLMKNLTPQIDGSTLKTLCMQHGPLKNFHLFLNNGIALVMYASGREANKAQKALNNCLLGNTTIQATMTSEGDANTIMTQLGGGSGSGGNGQQTSRGATPSSVMPKSTSSNDMWGNSMVPTSIYSGNNSIWGAPSGNDDGQRNTPQLQPYLPGDLLGESNM